MAITRTIERTVSLDAMAWRESLPGLAYQGEQNAHKFIIHCTQDGSPVTLTGSVLLKFLRPDGIAVDVPGSVVDGAAVVTLSGNCYEAMGRAEITIFVTQDSATVAVYSANTAVTRTTSGEEISGGDIINLPALQERFEEMAEAIEDAEEATANANGAVEYVAQTETSPAASAHAVGEYLIYNGTLYTATAAIASGDTLTVGTNIAAVADGLAGSVTDLKNAVTEQREDFDSFAYGTKKVGQLTQAYQYLACNAPNGTVIMAQSVDSSPISYGLLLYNSSKQQIGSVSKSSGSGGVAYYNITIDNVAYLRAPAELSSTANIYKKDGFDAEQKITDALSNIGNLSNLTTTAKTDVVSAINEVKQNSLTQDDKTTINNNISKLLSQELCAIIMGHNDDLRTTLNEQHNYIDFSYNGTNWVMTIPAGTKLIGKNQSVSISSTTTVTFAKQDDWIIAYNFVNDTVDAIRLSSYTTYISTYPNKYLLIATLVSKSGRWISPSINAEYTVNGIPAGFESIYHGIENIKYQMNIDFGDLNGTTGAYSAVNVRRMATVDILQYDYDVLVPAATNGIVAYLFTYSDSSGTLSEKIGAINSGTDYVISAGTYFRLLFYKDGDTGSYYGDKRNNFVFNNIFIYRRDDAERFVRISQRQNLGLYNENFRSVAHRGMSRIAPENTIPAYIEARRAGFIYVETDVAWTHDNVAVLLHDTTIDRTSNGTGNIADLDYDDIKDLDFGSWFSSKYAGTKIPTFEEFIQLCRKIGLYPVLDLRSHNQTQLDALTSMIIRNGMANHVEFVGGSPSGDYARIKESLPKAGYGYTVASSVTDEQIDAMLALKNGQNRVYITASTINSTMIESCADAGIELEFWPAGTAASILALDPYVTGATTEGLIGGWILYASVIPN